MTDMTTLTLEPEIPDFDAAGPVRAYDRRRAPLALSGLTIVLPCFNEAGNVAQSVRAATAAADRCAVAHEIIVVDDGSTDETSAIAAALVAADPRVRLIVHAHNRGYGGAVRSGITAATMPWLLLTDADLQFDLAELEDFLPASLHADLIVGVRADRQDPWHRRLNAAAWNALVRTMFHLPASDVDCAFKLLRTQYAQESALTSSGAMVSTELLVRCLSAGARFHEQPVHHHPRIAGHSTGANPGVIVRAFRELLGLHGTLHGAVPRSLGA